MNHQYSEATQTAESYYNNHETDRIYTLLWGGEHIHFGIYLQPDDSLAIASQRTVETLAARLQTINSTSKVIDVGAGYGGAARYLAQHYGCRVSCLNLSDLQNQRNSEINQSRNLSDRIEVTQGDFENIPYGDRSFDIAWSQDALVHSGNRRRVLEEMRRILKSSGELIFTDTLRDHDCPLEQLQPAFNRLQIRDMGSFHFYQTTLSALGFEEIKVIDLSHHVSTHYIRFRDALLNRYEEIIDITSKTAIDNALQSIEPWIDLYKKGNLQWGLFHYSLP